MLNGNPRSRPEVGDHRLIDQAVVRSWTDLFRLEKHEWNVKHHFTLVATAVGPQVEAGNYCVRTNPKGVDLNRNWDVALASLKMWDGHHKTWENIFNLISWARADLLWSNKNGARKNGSRRIPHWRVIVLFKSSPSFVKTFRIYPLNEHIWNISALAIANHGHPFKKSKEIFKFELRIYMRPCIQWIFLVIFHSSNWDSQSPKKAVRTHPLVATQIRALHRLASRKRKSWDLWLDPIRWMPWFWCVFFLKSIGSYRIKGCFNTLLEHTPKPLPKV